MTQRATTPDQSTNQHLDVQESFTEILSACRAARENETTAMPSRSECVLSQLGCLSPSQMLKLAACTKPGMGASALLQALCTSGLHEQEVTCRLAPEYNAHLALAA